MKHSAKAAARLARERSRQERRAAGRRRAGRPGQSPEQASTTTQPSTTAQASTTAQPRTTAQASAPAQANSPARASGTAQAGSTAAAVSQAAGTRRKPRRNRGLRATASRVGGVAAGQAEHQKLAQLPYAIVLAGTVAGLVLMQVAADAVRGGTLVIAGALLAASLTRLVLPEGRAGLLGSRRRLVDVALLTALGAGLLTAGLVVQVPG
jgi:hypothetical protein